MGRVHLWKGGYTPQYRKWILPSTNNCSALATLDTSFIEPSVWHIMINQNPWQSWEMKSSQSTESSQLHQKIWRFAMWGRHIWTWFGYGLSVLPNNDTDFWHCQMGVLLHHHSVQTTRQQHYHQQIQQQQHLSNIQPAQQHLLQNHSPLYSIQQSPPI